MATFFYLFVCLLFFFDPCKREEDVDMSWTQQSDLNVDTGDTY